MIMVLKRMVKMYQKIEMRFGVYRIKSINKRMGSATVYGLRIGIKNGGSAFC